MAEPRNAFASVEFLREVLVYGLVFVADVEQHLHDVLVRASVQRPLQRADCACDGAVYVALGGGDHAAGERRRVQAVVGVQQEHGVEHVGALPVGLFARHHVQEVLRGVEVVPWLYGFLALSRTVQGGEYRRGLREHRQRGFPVAVPAVAVDWDGGQRGPEHVHRNRVVT